MLAMLVIVSHSFHSVIVSSLLPVFTSFSLNGTGIPFPFRWNGTEKSPVFFASYYSWLPRYMYHSVAQYRWFCHFDDDVYVNVRELISVLDRHNPSSEPVYLGRWPLSREKMEVCIYVHGVILYHLLVTSRRF